MLSLSELLACPLILTLAGLGDCAPPAAPAHAGALTARPRDDNAWADQTLDVFFYPLAVALLLGELPHDFSPAPLVYPSDPGDPKPTGDPPPSGGDPPPSGGNPPPSGGNPPPTVKNTPEPATLISGMIGAGLVGLVGWRRRKRREDAAQ